MDEFLPQANSLVGTRVEKIQIEKGKGVKTVKFQGTAVDVGSSELKADIVKNLLMEDVASVLMKRMDKREKIDTSGKSTASHISIGEKIQHAAACLKTEGLLNYF